eukprot:Clim_evm3s13 gene=Clim_evmTU3s13
MEPPRQSGVVSHQPGAAPPPMGPNPGSGTASPVPPPPVGGSSMRAQPSGPAINEPPPSGPPTSIGQSLANRERKTNLAEIDPTDYANVQARYTAQEGHLNGWNDVPVAVLMRKHAATPTSGTESEGGADDDGGDFLQDLDKQIKDFEEAQGAKVKKPLADAIKRLRETVLKEGGNTQSLNPHLSGQLRELTVVLQKRDFAAAEKMHYVMVKAHGVEVSRWQMALKRIITEMKTAA